MTPQRPRTSTPVHALSRSSLIRVSSLADAVVDRVWPEVYASLRPVAKDDLRRSCHDNLGNVLRFLNDREDRAARHLATARSTGDRRARQKCPLAWVQHAWRVGGQVIWDDFAGQTGALDADELGQLVRSAGDVWQVVGELTAEMSAAYHAVERDIGTPDRRVHDLMDALFDGRGAEVAAQASRVLGLPARGRFVVVVSEDERPTVPGRLVRVLRPHGVLSVWHRRAGLTLGVLVSDGESRLPTELLRPLLSGRTGLSSVVTELTDLPEGHRMAELAMDTITPGASGVAALDDTLPDALLISSPHLAGRLVDVTFGPLLGLPAAERVELLDTAAAWIHSAGSAVGAARMLYCHRNTVQNRLHRIRALTGFDLANAETWSQVTLALSALRYRDRLPE